jgi:hypothetical protein
MSRQEELRLRLSALAAENPFYDYGECWGVNNRSA